MDIAEKLRSVHGAVATAERIIELMN